MSIKEIEEEERHLLQLVINLRDNAFPKDKDRDSQLTLYTNKVIDNKIKQDDS